MTLDQVRAQLVNVLRTIQMNSGLACPELSGSMKPVEQLEGFDSKVWPVAIGMLAIGLGVEIADDINIFASKDGTSAFSLDETAALVCKIAQAADETEAAQ